MTTATAPAAKELRCMAPGSRQAPGSGGSLCPSCRTARLNQPVSLNPWPSAAPLPAMCCMQILVVYNNSATTRAPLTLALSVDDGRSWEALAVIEDDKNGA